MKQNKEEVLAKLAEIIPGKNYPQNVEVTEVFKEGEPAKTIRFCLQSYYVGMYIAVYAPGSSMPHQNGDHNNRGIVTKLKKDLIDAVGRGAELEIGSILPIKTEM